MITPGGNGRSAGQQRCSELLSLLCQQRRLPAAARARPARFAPASLSSEAAAARGLLGLPCPCCCSPVKWTEEGKTGRRNVSLSQPQLPREGAGGRRSYPGASRVAWRSAAQRSERPLAAGLPLCPSYCGLTTDCIRRNTTQTRPPARPMVSVPHPLGVRVPIRLRVRTFSKKT